jgi:hypothetical protein
MQNEFEQMNRRSFLRLTGTGTAAVTINALLPHHLFAQAQETPLTDRAIPQNPILLRSSQLELTLDHEDGLPFSYRLLAN